ncbi:kinesin-like protein KIF16B isoform X4 [Cynoglossus semilaevis]|uniref:kinesin-like protein KIF16B isoform X4 n=1 Tax=Cynoglossus semilaevis TaxID=244447 RepID=UPI000494E030|nr:kinesin-like protein KIF16B isoform X4 [Cynoglossus semilaevis]
MASVKVAVRVRPMNQREKGLSSKSIIRVSGSTTYIQKPPHVRGEKVKERVKAFSFDFSYDSSDKESGAFANQEKVFNDLGSDVLKAAFEGFNTCVFAYGQTGSGKSFTMMGHTEDKGVIPRIGEGLFEEIAHKSKCETVSFRTEVSYLEIYNERVRDLLKRNKSPSEGGSLRVREHPKEGPYVENLSKHIIHNYSDMEVLIDLGNANRTTASTAMNDLSSRSHAIFTITFMQAWFDTDLPRETLSKIHLVDLAGSERADATRTTGTRLKEGANINKSLVTLGSVISTLADLSTAEQSTKTKQVFIPYRDSVLTWLLKDSLGGNSKTTMIATVSPADVNYTETLSTLRYASRAKNIVNAPTVNEDDSVKIIRELQAEVTRLQRLLDEASQTPSRELPSSVTVEKELHQNEAKVLALTKEWTSKWTETQTILQGDALALRKDGSGVVLDCQLPHFIGIGKDLLSTGIILYYLKEGWTQMGSDKTQDIVLQGPELLGEHCVVENCAGAVTLIPQDGALCSVNGSVVTDRCQLTQGNIIQLGSGTMLRFNHPSEAAQLREKRQNGLMSAFSLSLTDLSKSTENLSKVMLQNPGIVEDKEKCNHQEEPRQQYQVNLARSTLDKKRQKEDGEVPSEKKEEKMTGALVGETGNGLLAAVSEVQCSAASTELRTTLKEINIALAGQSLRLMGTTEDSILGVYTHSQKITKELCVVILGAICPGDNRISQHPLLHGDLMKMSLDCQVYVPDLLMDAGLRVCSQFHRSLADLIYLLHCNMDHTGIPLGDIHILLYFSVAACISPDSHSESLMQLFLTDTSFGLVQVDTVFHPTLCCVTLQPYRPLFCNLTLRQRSDVRCVLLHDEDERGAVRLDVILVNTKGRGHSESVSIATSPPAKASNSAPLAEVWKLTFSCSSEAAFLINHLSNV